MAEYLAIKEANGVWHLMATGGNAEFQPIVCGLNDDTGILFPGNGEWQHEENICADCMAHPRARARKTRVTA